MRVPQGVEPDLRHRPAVTVHLEPGVDARVFKHLLHALGHRSDAGPGHVEFSELRQHQPAPVTLGHLVEQAE